MMRNGDLRVWIFVDLDKLKKRDISGILAEREMIENHGLHAIVWDFYSQVVELGYGRFSEMPLICRYVRHLLREWPEILRYGSPYLWDIFLECTCKLSGLVDEVGREQFSCSPFFRKTLKGAGLSEENIFY
jgi:hypothetical protein